MSTAARAKFIEHMKLAGFSEHTQRSYINGVKGLANYHNQSPEKLTNGQVHMYFRYLVLERKLSWTTCSSYMCGILYFFRHLCKRKVDDRFGLPARVRSKKLPVVLSMEEVSRLLSCTQNLKHRVMLKTIYSAGLRVSEAVQLKPKHIESDPSRMMIKVEQGKGQKDRYTVLSEHLLCELRNYWREYTPGDWLFPGKSLDGHVSTSTVSRVFYRAKKKLAYPKSAAYIRFATHLQPTFCTTAMTCTQSASFLGIHQ